jgi:hypothetical protein
MVSRPGLQLAAGATAAMVMEIVHASVSYGGDGQTCCVYNHPVVWQRWNRCYDCMEFGYMSCEDIKSCNLKAKL